MSHNVNLEQKSRRFLRWWSQDVGGSILRQTGHNSGQIWRLIFCAFLMNVIDSRRSLVRLMHKGSVDARKIVTKLQEAVCKNHPTVSTWRQSRRLSEEEEIPLNARWREDGGGWLWRVAQRASNHHSIFIMWVFSQTQAFLYRIAILLSAGPASSLWRHPQDLAKLSSVAIAFLSPRITHLASSILLRAAIMVAKRYGKYWRTLDHWKMGFHRNTGIIMDDDYAYIPESYPLVGLYDRRLPCCGCGQGWFSFILGFIFPPAWYYGTFLYLTNYYRIDLRERSGLAACAAAALICTVAVLILTMAMLLKPWKL